MPGSAPKRRRAVVVGALGTSLEWYDFTLFIYLSSVISKEFFPARNQLYSLLGTYGIFAAGYIMRPLGGMFFGSLGDRRGRKIALLVSISLMSIPMLVTGFLPNERTIGFAAPLLLALMRLAQGLSVGGEFSGSIVLLYESAEEGRRGFTSNLSQVTAGAGFLLSSLTVTVLHSVLSTSQVDSWGWRLPFFLGFCVGVVTLLLQRTMAETEEFAHAAEAGETVKHPTRTLWQSERRSLVTVFLLMGYLGMAYYVVATFVPAWLEDVVHESASESLWAATIGALAYTIFSPYAGAISDRIGRKKPMVVSAVVLVGVAYPVFALMTKGTFATAVVGELALMAIVIVFTGASTPAIAELFSTRTRYSGVAIGYGLGIAIFGGTAPLIATSLVDVTGIKEAPSLMLIVGSVLALLLLARTPETLPGTSDLSAVDAAAPSRSSLPDLVVAPEPIAD